MSSTITYPWYRRLWAWLLLGWLSPAAAGAAPTEPGAPAEFIENRGQWDPAVRFLAPLGGNALFLENGGFTYAVAGPRTWPAHRTDTARATYQAHAYRVQLVGAGSAKPAGRQPTTERRNYFLSADSARWQTDVRSFREAWYPAVYAGTDLRLHADSLGRLEYDFLLQPGARPAAIRLRYAGTAGLRLLPDGRLQIQTSVGPVHELAPRAWQLDAQGRRQPVSCRYQLQGTEVSFQLGAYDPTRPLTIDPTVVFATFTGSTTDNWGYTAAPDADGNLYSASVAFSTGYPTTSGAYDVRFNGGLDVGIIKYNPAARGSAARLWSTYLGGSRTDVPHRIVCGPGNELIILGTTSSQNFPTTRRAYNRNFQGGPACEPENDVRYDRGTDLFVARLGANGRDLRGSTLLGSPGYDGFAQSYQPAGALPKFGEVFLGDVQTDAAGDIYVASTTTHRSFPATGAAGARYQGGPTDAVVCRFSGDLQQLRWSVLLGGSGADAAYGLSLDGAGRLYVAGATNSANFPVTTGAAPPPNSPGDAFVTCLAPDGSAVLHSRRLGTDAADAAHFVQAAPDGTVYLAGYSDGILPATPGRYAQPGGRAFIQQLSADLSISNWLTRLVPSNRVHLTGFLADDCGRLYLAGIGNTPGLPVVGAAAASGFYGTYVVRLSAGAVMAEYAGFFTGDHAHAVSRFGPDGTLYQAVCGDCSAGGRNTFSIPPGAGYYTTTNAARNCNDASLKILLAPGPNEPLSLQRCLDAGPLLLGGTPTGGTWSGPGVEPAPGGGQQFSPALVGLGVHALSYSPPVGASCPRTSLAVTVRPPVTIPPIAPLSLCEVATNASPLPMQPPGGTWSGPGVVANFFYADQAGVGTHTLTYTLDVPGSCGSGQARVTVLPRRVTAGPDTVVCGAGNRFRLTGGTPAGGTWSGPGVVNGWFEASRLPASYGQLVRSYYLTYTVNLPAGVCPPAATRQVTILDEPNPTPPPAPVACTFDSRLNGLVPFLITFPFPAQLKANPNVTPSNLPYGAQATWDFGDGTSIVTTSAEDYTYEYLTPGTYQPTLTVRYGPGCVGQVRFPALRLGLPVPPPNIITPNGDGLNDRFVQQFGCHVVLRVYSRWGNEVYRHADYANDWDGGTLAAGTYYYHLQTDDGRTLKGWVEIVR
jgi:gliding motility-associated-like protein